MSWDSFIDNLVAQSTDANGDVHCDRGCMIGIDDGAIWTPPSLDKTNVANITMAEAAQIAKCFKEKDFTTFIQNGIHIEATKYNFIKEEDGKVVMAKKVGMGGLTLQAAKKYFYCWMKLVGSNHNAER